ncbi:MAG: Lactate utilization protein [Chloroflexi bacterium]|nr:Lactate utilization protein [Chloroflexota bacterium]
MQDFLRNRFKERAVKAGATVLEVSDLTQAARTIARVIGEKGGGMIVATPDLLNEPIFSKEFDQPLHPATDELTVAGSAAGVSPGSFGIAETGSVVYAANDRLDRLVAMLSPIHFALLYAGDIAPDLEVAGGKLKDLQMNQGKRYVSFVTGPSRTADIERVLTIGVQGPKELFIVLIDGESEK